jgi:hypothetical protein
MVANATASPQQNGGRTVELLKNCIMKGGLLLSMIMLWLRPNACDDAPINILDKLIRSLWFTCVTIGAKMSDGAVSIDPRARAQLSLRAAGVLSLLDDIHERLEVYLREPGPILEAPTRFAAEMLRVHTTNFAVALEHMTSWNFQLDARRGFSPE